LAEKEMRQSTDHRLLLELTLVRLTGEIESSKLPGPRRGAQAAHPLASCGTPSSQTEVKRPLHRTHLSATPARHGGSICRRQRRRTRSPESLSNQ
jgi:hypothetical protein